MSLPICDSGPYDPKTPEFLRKGYEDDGCLGPETERRQIGETLDNWMIRVQEDCGLRSPYSDKCEHCYPEFHCLAGYPNKRPFCLEKPREPLITNIPIFERRLVSEKFRIQDQDDRVQLTLVKDKPHDIPVWERPRIRSQKLIGGEYKKVTDCFKKNGLSPPDCPRTASCQIIRNMMEWIEMDKQKKKSEEVIECCCCPGIKSSLPQFKCISCPPPGNYKPTLPTTSQYGTSKVQNQRENRRYSSPPKSSNRIAACLEMNNPRNSAEMWSDNVDIFKRHK